MQCTSFAKHCLVKIWKISNDSKNPFGSRKDRHEVIGKGSIGLEAMTRIVVHPALRGLPFILETPNELPGYAAEIILLRGLADSTAARG